MVYPDKLLIVFWKCFNLNHLSIYPQRSHSPHLLVSLFSSCKKCSNYYLLINWTLLFHNLLYDTFTLLLKLNIFMMFICIYNHIIIKKQCLFHLCLHKKGVHIRNHNRFSTSDYCLPYLINFLKSLSNKVGKNDCSGRGFAEGLHLFTSSQKQYVFIL